MNKTSSVCSLQREMMLTRIGEVVSNCNNCCELSKFRIKNDYWTVPGTGNCNAKIMLVGEAPGEKEAQSGYPFVGKSGVMLDQILALSGLKKPQVFITNILKCRPPHNRDPLDFEVSNCLGYLKLQIKIIKPTHIICLGRVASLNLLYSNQVRETWFSKSLESLRKKIHLFQGIKVACTYHPSFLCRNPGYIDRAVQDFLMVINDISLHADKEMEH